MCEKCAVGIPWRDEGGGRDGYETHIGQVVERELERSTGKPIRIDTDKIYPYPEVLRQSPAFTIQEAKEEYEGATDLKARDMIVPLDDTPLALCTRRHEAQHVLFSEPITKEQESLGMAMLTVEDGRISLMTKAAGIPFSDQPVLKEVPGVLEILKSEADFGQAANSTYKMAMTLIATAGDDETFDAIRGYIKASDNQMSFKGFQTIWHKCVRNAFRITGKTLAIMGKPRKKHKSCRTCRRRKAAGQKAVPCIHAKRALAAARFLEKWAVKNGADNSSLSTGMGSGCTRDGGRKPAVKSPYSDYLRSFGNPEGEEHFKPHGKKLPWEDIIDEWGEMTIDTPPRPHRAVARDKKAPLIYSRKMGVVPNRIHNWCTGRRVFSWTEPTGEKGGSILIDCSGSMGFSKAQLLDFVKAAPGLTVAGYSGYTDEGVLRVYIKKGMIVSDELIERPGGGNNVIDGPAIAWLSQQKAPRFWITDLGITGKNDRAKSPTTMRNICIQFCKRHSIIIIPDIPMAQRIINKHYGAA